MKVCKECGVEKSFSEFYENSGIGGYRPRCKPCYGIDTKRRRKRRGYKYKPSPQTRQNLNAAARKKFKKDPEFREKELERQREYRRKNRDKVNAKRRAKYKEDPSVVKAYVHKRQAAVDGAPGSFTADELRDLIEFYGGKCLACGTTENLGPDHIVPLSLGGTNWIWNVQPLCRSCNCSKHARFIDYRYPVLDNVVD